MDFEEAFDDCQTGFEDKTVVSNGHLLVENVGKFNQLTLRFDAGSDHDAFEYIVGRVWAVGQTIPAGVITVQNPNSQLATFDGFSAVTMNVGRLRSGQYAVIFRAKELGCTICLGIEHYVWVEISNPQTAGPLEDPVACRQLERALTRVDGAIVADRRAIAGLLNSNAPDIKRAFQLWRRAMNICRRNNRDPSGCALGDAVDFCPETSFGLRQTACEQLRQRTQDLDDRLAERLRLWRTKPDKCKHRSNL